MTLMEFQTYTPTRKDPLYSMTPCHDAVAFLFDSEKTTFLGFFDMYLVTLDKCDKV